MYVCKFESTFYLGTFDGTGNEVYGSKGIAARAWCSAPLVQAGIFAKPELLQSLTATNNLRTEF
jgi:hypothetical protein